MNYSALEQQFIPLSAIQFTSEWNLHPWQLSYIPKELDQSFRQAGILHPPILIDKGNDIYSILCGYKRLSFSLFAQSRKTLGCLVAAEGSTPDLLLAILLTEQNLYKPMSLTEKARFVEICRHFFDDTEILRKYHSCLHLPREFSNLVDLLSLLQLDPILLTAIDTGQLQEKVLTDLLRLPTDDRLALVKLFTDLAMGNNKQKRFMSLICDLAARNDCSVASYLHRPPVIEILEHPILNVPQKIQHLTTYLQIQHSPMHSQAEDHFQLQLRQMNLPSHFSVSHSPSFEKDAVTLSITCQDLEECRQLIADLQDTTLRRYFAG